MSRGGTQSRRQRRCGSTARGVRDWRAGFLKRLEQLAQSINVKRARQIILEVDGKVPTDDAAEAAILQPLAVQPTDLVIVIRKFGAVDGLPRIASVTSL